VCGIAGCVDTGLADSRKAVERQLHTLAHRGPDASGIFAGPDAAIGQNRLRVVDLVTGDPPVTNEDRTIGAVLNGEIYNFDALREDLRSRGHTLRTKGDTEVLAHLAETLGGAALARRLDGMFAFAVWDDRRRRLVLGRDRLGKKPLYWWSGRGGIVFGSEIKAVLAHPAVPRELDQDAIPGYLTFGYVPTPHTFFAGIQSLPPGHVLVAEHGDFRMERYWEPPLARRAEDIARDLSPSDAACEARVRLAAAVRRRLVADVPIGAFLSGGVDSSTVVALMAQESDRPVRTFTIGFEDDEGFDERPYAKFVTERFATEHTEFVVRPDTIDLIERLVWHHDQPFGDSSAIPTFLLSELTRGHVTVALSGDGGDELFAGYERFNAALALDRFGPVLRSRAVAGLTALPVWPGRAGRVRRALQHAPAGLPDAYLRWVTFIGDDARRALVGSAESDALDQHRSIWDRSGGADTLHRLLDLNLRTYLLDDLLVKVDRMSMAHGLEVRSPLLDHDLVEFAMRLPARHHIGMVRRKRVLRAAVKELLPGEVLRRRKRGFGVPLDRWFRTDLRDYVERRLGSPRARIRQYLAGAPLDALLGEHLSGHARHGHALWTLLTLDVFLERERW
jgi:asparagine synthase (glutamine-hydrolysing)